MENMENAMANENAIVPAEVKVTLGSKIKAGFKKFAKPILIVGGIAGGALAAGYFLGGGINNDGYDEDYDAIDTETADSDE